MSITDRPIKSVVLYDEQGDPASISSNGALFVSGAFGTQDSVGRQVIVLPARNRVSIVFQGTPSATSDTLLSLVKSTNGTAVGGATTIAVAAGKTLRITSMAFSVKTAAAAAAFATFSLRINPSGAAVIGSQVEFRFDVGITEAVIGGARGVVVPIPDGFELSGTHQLGISTVCQATTNVLNVSLSGYEY